MGRGAKGQLFQRNQYLVVGLAPLVVITLAGISFTLASPALASYTIFATAGNISGSAGDPMGRPEITAAAILHTGGRHRSRL